MMTESTNGNEHELSQKFTCKCGLTTDFIEVINYHFKYPKREITFETAKRLIK